MRVKNYLRTRGVEFDAFDVSTDPAAAKDLLALGVKGLPVVAKGDRFVIAVDLTSVDKLLGIEREGLVLPGQELIDRSMRIIEAWARFAKQLPASHYDDPIPGLEGLTEFALPDGHILRLSDGTPYVPHGTAIGLVRHIFGHISKLKLLLENPDSSVFASPGPYNEYGEPLPAVDVGQLTAQGESILKDVGRWSRRAPEQSFNYVVQSFTGPQTMQQLLLRETYSLTHHTRQLMTKLRELDIEPNGPIGEAEYSGLNLSKNVWE